MLKTHVFQLFIQLSGVCYHLDISHAVQSPFVTHMTLSSQADNHTISCGGLAASGVTFWARVNGQMQIYAPVIELRHQSEMLPRSFLHAMSIVYIWGEKLF